MAIDFERGDPSNPRGHALLYFISETDQSQVYATYLIVPPINIELAKYMPPMFASKVSMTDVENVSSIPLPPVPEKVDSVAYLQALAESRGDDLVHGGTVDESEVERMLYRTSEAAQDYLRLYNGRPALPEPVQELAGESEENVSEVFYSVMSDKDKLSELAKFTGSLRYAIEGNDSSQAEEVLKEMEGLSKHLGVKYRVDELIKAAQTPGVVGSKLSQLYTERCYKLCEEDYLAVAELEDEINRLKNG
jgi:hypothetical protein